mgnify:CR=1 FL=1
MVSIIPRKEIEEKTLAMSAFFETGKPYPESYGVTSGNHDGAGLSHGVLQYNFGTGSLNTLWRYMINTHPQVCLNAFMGDVARHDEWKAVVQDTVVANQIAWGTSITHPDNDHMVIEPWSTYFMNLGTSQESIDKQVSMSSSWRVNADNWFNAITQIWSRKAYYLLWDISVQMGRFNPLSQVQTEFADSANYVGKTEEQAEQWRCDRLAWHSAYNNAVSAANQAGVFQRKDMIAKEAGDWWGNIYNGVVFDAILEPYSAAEKTYTFPIITTLIENNLRTKNAMSSAPEYNQTVVTIAFDKPITKYKVCRGGTDHTTGVVLEEQNVSYSAGQTFTITIDYLDLTNGDNTVYFYGMDAEGRWSDGFIPAPPVPTKPTVRYIRIDGYGEVSAGTPNSNTRMIEVELFSGGTNRLSGKTGAAGQAMSITGTAEVGGTAPSKITDGVKGITGSTYNAWWNSPVPNAFVKFDLGANYVVDSMRYWAYTARAPRFKIYGSINSADIPNTGAISDTFIIWDNSLNDTLAGSTAGTNNFVEKVF